MTAQNPPGSPFPRLAQAASPAKVGAFRRRDSLYALILLLGLIVSATVTGCAPAPTSTPVAPRAASVPRGEPPGLTAAAAVPSSAAGAQPCSEIDKVTLQLKWTTNAQFAGYYAADEGGDYRAECLDVTILPGSPDSVAEPVVAQGTAQFGVTWLASLLRFREQGLPIQTIAQVFQSSGMREISWKSDGIRSAADLRGKKAAVWLEGDQYQYALFATLAKHQLDPTKDLTIVPQSFDLDQLMARQVDAAAAMTYEELAQVLETRDPATGELYRLEDIDQIDFNREGTAMLEDGLFANEDWLKEPRNQDITVRFLRASLRGWIRCRERPDACVDLVMRLGPHSGRGRQAWQMNEVNKLIWPSPAGIGIMDPALWRQTADIAHAQGMLKRPADASAYTNAYARRALEGLGELDSSGASWVAPVVEATEGGR